MRSPPQRATTTPDQDIGNGHPPVTRRETLVGAPDHAIGCGERAGGGRHAGTGAPPSVPGPLNPDTRPLRFVDRATDAATPSGQLEQSDKTPGDRREWVE
ncbi:hypothetical protein Acsp01_19430 [Actinoplanes sp. NBRC 101535]|nr:hypothetical protein Acsp01_19430 [Actinoplanes sp. NBRC 101535]